MIALNCSSFIAPAPRHAVACQASFGRNDSQCRLQDGHTTNRLFFQSNCSRLYVLAHAYSTVTNGSLQYRRAGVMLLQRPGTRVSQKALRAQASVLQMVQAGAANCGGHCKDWLSVIA